MKQFLVKTSLFFLLFFAFDEIFSRVFLDPLYFYSLNSYNLKTDRPGFRGIYASKETEHVDYLFMGSSRVPAAINPSLIMNKYPGITVVVAGRGYMTEGIQYQALKNKLFHYPDFLKGAKVFIEYSGSDVYSGSFAENKLKVYEPLVSIEKPMPQLLLPHLNFNSLLSFLKESKNANSVKVEMVLLFCFSSYRTIPLMKEKFSRIGEYFNSSNTQLKLASEGGIRNDNFEIAKKKAVDIAEIELKSIQDHPLLTFKNLDKSSLAYLNDLINRNGGTLYLFKMPISSLQKSIYLTAKAKQNNRIFEQWIFSKGIKVINNEKFHFQNSDFPDTWHLGENRRDEFTLLLFNEIKSRLAAQRN